MMNKKIGYVKESKDKVQAFDEKGNYMFTKYGKISSYTSDNISIKNNCGKDRIYDTNGSYKFTR